MSIHKNIIEVVVGVKSSLFQAIVNCYNFVNIAGVNTLFPTEIHLKNVYYLYSACSNPTNVVLLVVLSMIIGKDA
jgi:hypothetical protein